MSRWMGIGGALLALAFTSLQACDDDEEGDDSAQGGSDAEAGESGRSGSGNGGTGKGGAGAGGTSGRAGEAGDGGGAGGGGNSGAGAGGAAGGAADGGEPSGAGMGGDGPTGPCDPLRPAGAQGCPSGEKCTWTRITTDTGELACVPSGTVQREAPCAFDGTTASGAEYDNCAAGLVCATGICLTVCDVTVGISTCRPGEACSGYVGLFANGTEDPTAGACQPTCDPLTQTRVLNGMSTTCGPGRGCYVEQDGPDAFAVCAPAGTATHNQAVSAPIYSNSCAPGHIARFAVQGTQTYECAAHCKPADVYVGMNDGVGARPSYEGGDPRFPNWANQPATCESAGGASVRPEVPTTGESCIHFWTHETGEKLTPFSNTLGACFNHASHTYNPGTGAVPWPRCSALTDSDVLLPLDGESDALSFGCKALPDPTMLEREAPRSRRTADLRLHLFTEHPR